MRLSVMKVVVLHTWCSCAAVAACAVAAVVFEG